MAFATPSPSDDARSRRGLPGGPALRPGSSQDHGPAGAVADGETLARAEALGMDPEDYFRRSDSYTFFDRLDDALVTGPSGNNVRTSVGWSPGEFQAPRGADLRVGVSRAAAVDRAGRHDRWKQPRSSRDLET